MSYEEIVQQIKKLKLESRWEILSYCIGYLGVIDKNTYDLINKAYYEDKLLKR